MANEPKYIIQLPHTTALMTDSAVRKALRNQTINDLITARREHETDWHPLYHILPLTPAHLTRLPPPPSRILPPTPRTATTVLLSAGAIGVVLLAITINWKEVGNLSLIAATQKQLSNQTEVVAEKLRTHWRHNASPANQALPKLIASAEAAQSQNIRELFAQHNAAQQNLGRVESACLTQMQAETQSILPTPPPEEVNAWRTLAHQWTEKAAALQTINNAFYRQLAQVSAPHPQLLNLKSFLADYCDHTTEIGYALEQLTIEMANTSSHPTQQRQRLLTTKANLRTKFSQLDQLRTATQPAQNR